MESFLGQVTQFLQQRNIWLVSSRWLDDLAVAPVEVRIHDLLQLCRDRLSHVPWKSTVPGFSDAISLSSRSLAVLLSDKWLDDELINAGSEYIMRQLGATSRSQILNCFFLSHLRNMRSRSLIYSPRKPRILDARVRDLELDILWIPVHVDGNHWCLIKVDLTSRTIMYADSRNPSAFAPRQDINILKWWLHTLLPGTAFTEAPANFEVPNQVDGDSCGIVVLSILARELAGYESWSQDLAAAFRMLWFLRLSEVYAHEPSIEVCLYCITCRSWAHIDFQDISSGSFGPVDHMEVDIVDTQANAFGMEVDWDDSVMDLSDSENITPSSGQPFTPSTFSDYDGFSSDSSDDSDSGALLGSPRKRHWRHSRHQSR